MPISTTIGSLKDALRQAGYDARLWIAGDGQLLVMDYGARVVACALPGVEENLFWHNPALLDAQQTTGIIDAAGGGIGGDRFWVAPEIGYMWSDLAAARLDPVSTARLPGQLDPGDYGAIDEGPARVVLGTEMTLTDHRFSRSITLDVTREVSVVGSLPDLPTSINSVSFSIRNDLSLVEGDNEAVAGGWDILQVPPTGTLICPTVLPVAEARSYYDAFGDQHVQYDDRSVRFLVDGKRRVKMGLRAEHLTGRMGYYRELNGEQASLILRFFLPLPGEPYVDLPRSSDDTFGGDALQAYNDDGTYGGFGEMEYHDPAVVVGCGPTLRTGISVTHVLAGPAAEIRNVGEQLLGVPIVPIA